MILTIRPEQPEDISEIREIVKSAFREAPHTSTKEHFLVDLLREKGDLHLSRVAEQDGCMVGHIAVSSVKLSCGAKNWFGIGPVSVVPDFQGQGGGSKLIASTLSQLRDAGAAGCVLVGDPAYYTRFGFRHVSALTYAGIPEGYFLALSFNNRYPSGSVTYPDAFSH
ncbi:GNAT family N-acetyltransferase [Salinimonas lutimaris]|uniref:GNAT family N-acetyltransferase n=1 Tax=Salinimonas lutimaris TaxID=914153 RepID=UPI0010C15428|nr:N-acetyltransferase [Salinimonas lutimaris]